MSQARDNVLELLRARGLPRAGQPLPLLTLEEFFTGNDDEASLGENLSHHPGLKTFYEILLAVRERPEVQDVLVEIAEVAADGSEAWPASEQIYVLAAAERQEVEDWLDELEPDAIVEGYHLDTPPGAPPLGDGVRVWGVWWD